jgi:hypothetical protein
LSPEGNQYIKNPNSTITYLTGPNANKSVLTDPSGLEYTLNPDGTRKYLVDPSTTELPKPSAQQVINNLVDGNAKIVTTNGNTYIVYTDPIGKNFAVPATKTPDGLIFTDSTGTPYFISSQTGSKPLQISTDSIGNQYVINSDGTLTIIKKAPNSPTSPASPTTQISPKSPTLPINSTNLTIPTSLTNNVSPISPSIPVSPTSSTNPRMTDIFGQYEVVNGIRKYLTGPYVGKSIIKDPQGN